MFNKHTQTLVPLEVWAYNSPELLSVRVKADIGLFIESLIYYDKIFLNISQPNVFVDLLNWFITQHSFRDLLNLFEDGTVQIYDYSFNSAPVNIGGTYSLFNITDPIQNQAHTYEKRILYSKEVSSCLKNANKKALLYKVLKDRVIEVKANQFGNAINNAREDLKKTDKNELLVQSFIDHIYKIKKLGKPPSIKTEIIIQPNGNQTINYNFNFDQISSIIGSEIGFSNHLPLSAIIHANRFIQSAAELSYDLYLGSPMSTIVGEKIDECNKKIIKTNSTIQNLKLEVEFPDLRLLVNNNRINFQDILSIRKKQKSLEIGYSMKVNEIEKLSLLIIVKSQRVSDLIKISKEL